MAIAGYAVATALALAQIVARRAHAFHWFTGTPARAALTVVTFASTALFPLITEAWQTAGGRTDRAQDEVLVIQAGGERLWHSGTPYLSHDAIAALPVDARLDGYLPYQAAMALYGLPRAWFGVHWWTDARVWFAATLMITVALAVRLIWAGSTPDPAGRDAALVRAVQSVTVLPICALTLATGGDDLVILGFCLLAFACAARDRFGAAGVMVGIAGAMKLFAWPVAIVLLVLALVRGRGQARLESDGRIRTMWDLSRWDRGQWRRPIRYAIGAIGLPIFVLIPAVIVDRGAAIENVVKFPLGRGLVRSPAASPFPGHLIADGAPSGKEIATALLVLAAITIGGWLLIRPPRTAAAAAVVSAWGLLAAIALIPASRFGYLLYPAAYAVWAAALRHVGPKPTSDEVTEAG